MDENLRKVMLWASHGTPRQFYYELVARLSEQGYEVNLEEDVLTVFKTRREGGFLGIGGRKIKDVSLKISYNGDDVTIDEESASLELAAYLSKALEAH